LYNTNISLLYIAIWPVPSTEQKIESDQAFADFPGDKCKFAMLEGKTLKNSMSGYYFSWTGMIFLLVLLFLFTGRDVQAHIPLDTDVPATREEPIRVDDHRISWAAYSQLERQETIEYYRFSAEAGEEIFAEMLVPVLDRLENFTPDFALIGPGLENDFDGLNREEVEARLDIREGEGVIVRGYHQEESEIFREHFTQTSYWRRQQDTITAPESGVYHLAVFSREGVTGKYVLAIGREEKWGARDIARMPKIWWVVRIFMEQERSTYAITALLGAGALYLITRLIK